VSEYTPTTGEVEFYFSRGRGYETGAEQLQRFAEFDRWLAEVKAQAWADGYTAGTHDWRTESLTTPNPYRGENK
jgi:hypothetical protein